MAKINTVIVAEVGDKSDPEAVVFYDVSALLDDGTQIKIEKGFEFFTAAEMQALIEAQTAHVAGLRGEIEKLADAGINHEHAIAEMQNEIRLLNASTIIDPRPLLHEEHLDIPVPRTLDRLAPLDALMPHPSLDEALPAETSTGEPDPGMTGGEPDPGMTGGEPSKE